MKWFVLASRCPYHHSHPSPSSITLREITADALHPVGCEWLGAVGVCWYDEAFGYDLTVKLGRSIEPCPREGSYLRADLNWDGCVDGADYTVLSDQWGTCHRIEPFPPLSTEVAVEPPPNPDVPNDVGVVPEPGLSLALAVGAVALALFPRRRS